MNLSLTFWQRVVTTVSITTTFTLNPVLSTIAQTDTLNGAGATFAEPLYQRYALEFKQKHPNLRINYQGIGSGGGIRQIIAGTIDFGGSDAAMKDSEIAKVKNGIILVPTAGGAVSVVYNLPGVHHLRLSRTTLPAIFSGQITNWNNAKIKADNPNVDLPNQPIKFVVRADGSGTTFIFTNHLSANSAYFKGLIGIGTHPQWPLPNVLKGRGNPGVAALVSRTTGSIGYVEYDYAVQNQLIPALIQNKRGEFVAPSLESANQALATIKFPRNFRVFIPEPPQGYPIVGLTWMLIYKQYSDPDKAKAVKQWINWVLTSGQQYNEVLNYTRIPNGVAHRVLTIVNSTVR